MPTSCALPVSAFSPQLLVTSMTETRQFTMWGSRCRGARHLREGGSSWQDKHRSGRPGGLLTTPPHPAGYWKPSPLAPQDCLGKAQLREVFLTSGMAVHLESSLRPFLAFHYFHSSLRGLEKRTLMLILWWSVSLRGVSE